MKKIIALIIALMAIGLFTGCGSSNSSSHKGNLTGFVTYTDGTPAEGATVKLYPYFSAIIAINTVTNTDGTFALKDVPEGMYEIVITKEEYSSTSLVIVQAESTLPVPPQNTILKVNNTRRLVMGDQFTGNMTINGTTTDFIQTITGNKFVAKYPLTSFDKKPVIEMSNIINISDASSNIYIMRNADNSVYSVTGTPNGSLFNIDSSNTISCIIPSGELNVGLSWEYTIQGSTPVNAIIVAEEDIVIDGQSFKTFKYTAGTNEYWICPRLGTIVKSKYTNSSGDNIETIITSYNVFG